MCPEYSIFPFLYFFCSFRPVQPGCKIPASPYSVQNAPIQNTGVQPAPITKHSMLDKLKLFNKEKSDRSSKTQVSKRTSSSSGFSSARSERSDSSLSLNDGQSQQLTSGKILSSSAKKPTADPNCAKSKTKLLSSSKTTSKELAPPITSKSKKDKSPARCPDPADSKMVAPKNLQKLPTAKPDAKLKCSSGTKKLEVRSESRTSLSHIQPPKMMVPPAPAPAAGTGIPKPTAFIKGTTKPTHLLHQKPNDTSETKPDKSHDISTQQSNISGPEPKMHIVVMENGNGSGSTLAPNNFHHHVHHHQQMLMNQNISMTDSSHSKSTHSSSTGLHSNSSESSVIYRPSSESGSDAMYVKSNGAMSPQQQPPPLHKNIIPNRKVDHHFGPAGMIQENGHKFNTVPSKMLHGNGIIFEEEKQMTIMPMRPLLRGYNSHVTLPTRGTRGQHLVSEYCEDIGQGYCSDGDALRKIPVRYSDIENGYLSEGGGGGIHGKHMISVMRGRTQLPTTIEER